MVWSGSAAWRTNGSLVAGEVLQGERCGQLVSCPIEIEVAHSQHTGDVTQVSKLDTLLRNHRLSKKGKGRSLSLKEKADLLLQVKDGPQMVIALSGDVKAETMEGGVLLRSKNGPVLHGDWVSITKNDEPGFKFLAIPVSILYSGASVLEALEKIGDGDVLVDLYDTFWGWMKASGGKRGGRSSKDD